MDHFPSRPGQDWLRNVGKLPDARPHDKRFFGLEHLDPMKRDVA